MSAARTTARRERVRARWALIGCVLSGLSGCRGAVRGGLDEGQANEILVALDGSGIAATKVEETGALAGRFRVEVPQSSLGRALRALQERGLPRRAPPGFEELLEEPGLLPTPGGERARTLAAISGELARSLARLRGVLDARVHLAPALELRALDDPPAPRKASVLLQVAPDASIDDASIRRMVAAAVDGLDAGNVEVVRVPVPEPRARPVRLVQVGPADVSAESAPALRGLLAGALVLEIVMAIALVLVWRTRRSAPSAR